MSNTSTEHPPIYSQLVDEHGDVPAETAATAATVLHEAQQAMASFGRRDGTSAAGPESAGSESGASAGDEDLLPS
ncbi:hypothetical protein [Streptomyces sp. ODS28]|uniref:hypothetical protein n=1 Tax=Streptomyces sp. ODS28 TaxID=3136688 RepID=UPI0031E7CF0E